MLRTLFFTAVLAAGLAIPAFAQDDDDDGPGRGVARISVINGDVSVRRGDSGDVIAAAINSPLVVQDRLLTGPASRAEVQFDWANMIRLSREAEIRFAELEYKRYIVQVARGTVTFRVLRDHDADVELSTPSISVRPVKKGEYRITVLDDGTSEITVRSGEAEIYTPKGSERLKSGRTMLARGTAAEPEFRVVAELQQDEWDRWNERRDKDLSRSRSYNYVSRDIYGADDLDDHGRWVSAPNYGWVWAPRVAAGWAPYRHGRWSWVDYYGWSWVSYDPWGWAPYHYGRWFYSAPYGWCWWPGAVHTRHYWRPGLVAFFGFGNVRVGLGFGNIGWVPLAPFERYRPWYGRNYYNGYRNNTFVNNNVRIVNNVNITNVYRNARIDQAVTVLDHDGFRGGRSGGAYRARDGEFSRVNAFEGRLPITPGRESLRLADRDSSVRVASTRDDGRFFSRRAPAAVDRVPFEDQRRGMEQVARRTFGEDTTPRRDADAGGAGSGWRRVGESGGASGGQRTSPGAVGGMERSFGGASGRGADDNGWRRFGSPRIESSDNGGGTVSGRDNSGGRFGQPAATPDSRESRGSDRQSDWRGFSGRSERSSEAPGTITGSGRGAAERNSDSGNWRRDVTPRSEPQQPRAEPPTRSERQDAPRMERRSDGGGGRGTGDSVRISPPIVRERPSYGGGGGGGGERSAPSMSRGSDGGGGRFGGGAAPSAGGGGGGGARGSDPGGGGGAGGRGSAGGGRGR
ncbi:MAG TPA: DUF6600 domain-containing protein [Bryobacteraceae bacterium]|nr:DUF6600 domain-containing protein [Bryobacteraceae bacterium]